MYEYWIKFFTTFLYKEKFVPLQLVPSSSLRGNILLYRIIWNKYPQRKEGTSISKNSLFLSSSSNEESGRKIHADRERKRENRGVGNRLLFRDSESRGVIQILSSRGVDSGSKEWESEREKKKRGGWKKTVANELALSSIVERVVPTCDKLCRSYRKILWKLG